MKKHTLTAILFFLLFFIVCSYAHAAVYYVNDDSVGPNTGEDWDNAFTDLQAALDLVISGDEVWVATGTYYPTVEHDGSGDRYRSFQMINGVSIYGGFNGTETIIDQRDIQANPTILSGDIGVQDDASDNCYHVFYHPSGLNLDETAVLDGFIITGGNADGSSPNYNGGGMYNYYSDPTLRNCTFIWNTADYGGGMYNYSSSPTMSNCTFSGNTSDNYAGGMYNYSSSPTMSNCIFSGNAAVYGGGMRNYSSSSPTLINCTFSGNTSDNYAGGMYNSSSSSPTLVNCIMWGDSLSEIYNSSSSPFISYCDIQGSGGSGGSWNGAYGTDGGNNIDGDPLFTRNPDPGTDSEWGTEDDDYGDFHLTASSPCIDSGDPSSSGDTDMDGESRVIDGDGDEQAVIDMGVDEFLDTDQDGLTDIWEEDNGLDPEDPDSDDDGMSDGFEIIYFGDNTRDGSGDYDEDGLTDLQEYQEGTYPDDPDSDDDGLTDSEEVNNHGTDPMDADSDDDGLTDGEEENNHGTNPLDADSDDDGMPDGWEVSYGLNPLVNDADEDPDGDSYSNIEEYAEGTYPDDPDSDDDGLTDGDEVNNHGTDPMDSDSDDDGLTDGDEVNNHGTDPMDMDSDDDGLTDGEEVNSHGTDPMDADSDDDGMPDEWEIQYGLNPLVNDANEDPDGDSYSNIQEYGEGTYPNDPDSDDDGLLDGEEVNNHGTDPMDADSDDDGMPDGWEVSYGLNPLVNDADEDPDGDSYSNIEEYAEGTYPDDPDSDDDGLTDGDEVNNHGTDPMDSDSDDDGLTDGDEVNNHGTDPMDSDSDDDGYSDNLEILRESDPNNNQNIPLPTTIYVNDDAAGSSNGKDWDNAFTELQGALGLAIAGDEIRVAAGTYYPTVERGGSGDRYRSFQMINGVSIYGGFNGTETTVDQRDIQANPTILSGDIGVQDDASDNCYHVFYHPDGLSLDETAVLDGFTITGGNADGSYPDYNGGGMYNYNSDPTLSNCTFDSNDGSDGGGMYNGSSSPTLMNCAFNRNTAYSGGGIFNSSSDPTLTNCTFKGNSVDYQGGGMFNWDYSSPTLTNCIFSGNTADYDGGGMHNWAFSSPTLTNCIFSGNTADDYGGGMNNSGDSSPTLLNCTFSSNTATLGSGMYNGGNRSSPILTNCILWGDISDEIYNVVSSEPFISYCNIKESGGSGGSWNGGYGTDGGGNIDVDPLFIRNPDPGTDSEWGTEDDDYGDLHLTISSPCIDSGDPSSSGDTDMDGESRVADGDGDEQAVIDMGADEYLDTDGDETPDRMDGCPYDPNKLTDSDTDSDGILDCNDAFPDDPDEWSDNDSDGIGDNTDTDDDDDGMPDEWEEQYGLDPLVNDSSGDPDNDAYTNLEEYQNGTNPNVAEISHPDAGTTAIFEEGFESYPTGPVAAAEGSPWVQYSSGSYGDVVAGSAHSGEKMFKIYSNLVSTETDFVVLELPQKPSKLIVELWYYPHSQFVYKEFAGFGLGYSSNGSDLSRLTRLKGSGNNLLFNVGQGSYTTVFEELVYDEYNYIRTEYDFNQNKVKFYAGTDTRAPLRSTIDFDGSMEFNALYLQGYLNYTYIDDITVSVPICDVIISGTPDSPTNETDAALSVGGVEIITYRYRLDDGSYGDETPVSNDINLTDLSEGLHTVYVIGKDENDNWTPEENAASVSWTVDTTAPVITGLSDDSTPALNKTWIWGATDESAVTYRYKIDQAETWDNPAGAYSDKTIAAIFLGEGTWYLHVQAKDAAGNESDVFTVSAVLYTTSDWNSQSPPPVTEGLADFHIFNDTDIIAVGDSGTIKKTTDAGENWQSISSGTTSALYSVFFMNSTTGWAVGSSGTILYTTDGGESWTVQSSGTSASLKSVYFVDESIGWAVGDSYTILKTTNGGVNWESQSPGNLPRYLEDVYFLDASTGFVAGNNGIYRTTDGGENWTDLLTGAVWTKKIYFLNESEGWAVGISASYISINCDVFMGCSVDMDGEHSAIWKTTDGGETWEDTVFTSTNWLYDVYFKDTNTGWAVGSSGKILYTPDGGSSWYTMSSSSASLRAVQFSGSTDGWIMGDSGIILNSIDSGLTWGFNSGDGTSENIASTYFIDGLTGWAATASGTIIKTTDGGHSWIYPKTYSDHHFSSIHFTDETTGWAASTDGKILHTTDGGSNWSSQSTGTGNDLESVYFVDASNGWAVGEDYTIIHTTDGGSGWSAQSSGITGDSLNSVFFTDTSTGWAAGSSGNILHTTDGGYNWDVQTSGTTSSLNSVFFMDDTTGWAAGDSGTILHTTDGGENWTLRHSGTSSNLNSLFFIDANTGWIAGDSGTVLKTTDGGISWGTLFYDTANNLNSVYLSSSATGWIAGDDGLIIRSDRGGGTILYPPDLSEPPDNSDGIPIDPTLSWNPAEGAQSYKLQVSVSSDFSDYYLNESGIIDTEYNVGELDESTTYYWHVKSANSDFTSTWSRVWSFETVYPPDSDDDGLIDDIENGTCTDPDDADTDDDGIPDGEEDSNLNGVVDAGETDPCDADTDDDGIQDGTELGYTTGHPTDTDNGIFQPDLDDSTTTDPLDDDSDDDGYLDGEEDVNHNGMVDGDETDPNEIPVYDLTYTDDLSPYNITWDDMTFASFTESPPGGLILPAFSGNEQLYGILYLGDSPDPDFHFAVDLFMIDEDLATVHIYLDRNKNNDLTDDGPPLEGPGNTYIKVPTFDVPYSSGISRPFSFEIQVYYFEYSQDYWIYTRRSCGWTGTVSIHSLSLPVLLVDADTNGLYDTSSNDFMLIDLDGNGLLDGDYYESDDVVRHSEIFFFGEQAYELYAVPLDGTSLSLRSIPVASNISGEVRSSIDASGLDRSKVRVSGWGIEKIIYTDQDGFYSVDLPEGSWDLRATRLGYIPQTISNIEIQEDQSVNINIDLDPIPDPCSGTITLGQDESYDFARGVIGTYDEGDFYYNYNFFDAWYTRGLQDLGNIGDVPLSEVDPPVSGYDTLEMAIEGNTYVSKAKEGEEGGFIAFRVISMDSETVTIEYHYIILEDIDDDGLLNIDEETVYGSDPEDPDTDDDEMPDGWEVSYSLDPNYDADAYDDFDDDGLINLEEYWSNTNPNDADTDDDGMPDGWEVSYSLDPDYDADAGEDADDDGLTNLEEYQNGTDPNNSDSDSDSTPDGEDGCPNDPDKVNPGQCGCGVADTDSDGDGTADCIDEYPDEYDNDGMPDEWEEENDLDPLVDDADEDADGDGFSNIQEYKRGTDPQDTESHPSRGMPWLMLLLEE